MRQTKLSEKDLSVLRDTMSAKEQHKRSQATIKDYSLNHRVSMEWDLNADSTRDKIFRLNVDGASVLLDWEEVLKAGRFI